MAFGWMTHEAARQACVRQPVLVSLVLFAVAAFSAIFAMAWWSNWKTTSSSRIWGVLAGLTIFLNTLWPGFQYMRYSWVYQAIGLLGIIAFAWRDE